MRNFYEFQLEEVAFDDSSMHVLNEALGELDPVHSRREPATLSTADMVELFLEYRKRAGRRGRKSAR